jgi:hypothetical protein
MFALLAYSFDMFTPFIHSAWSGWLRCGNLVVYHCKASNKVGLHVPVIARLLLALPAFLLVVTCCEGFLGGARSLLVPFILFSQHSLLMQM